MTTPSSATVWITRSNACDAAFASPPNASVNAALGTPIQPSICGPSMTPARISPMTAGCPMRSHTSANSLAATNMSSRSSRIHPTGVISGCLWDAPKARPTHRQLVDARASTPLPQMRARVARVARVAAQVRVARRSVRCSEGHAHASTEREFTGLDGRGRPGGRCQGARCDHVRGLRTDNPAAII